MSILLLVFLMLLVAINGFFVAAEFAIVRSRRARLEQLRDEGNRGALLGLRLIDRVDEFVATCQVGITLASLGIGFLGEPALAELLEPVFGEFLGHTAAIAVAIAFAFTTVTFLHVILGEQAPKMLAIARAETSLIRIARPLIFFRTVLHPLIIATNAPANWIVRVFFRVDPDSVGEETSPEELRLLISRGAQRGRLDPGEAGMLGGVFHLHEQEAREVMTPIPAVVTVDASETVEAALRRCVTSGHTRLVVIEDDNPDRVKGIVHNNSLARLYMSDGPEASIGPVIREALIVPETRPLDDLLHDLQVQRTSLSVIVDEYGRTVGLVTVEDILEEVVGEIEDETDPRAAALRQLTNGDWFVRGHVSLGDLEDAGIELPVEGDTYNSIGGYVFGELGRLPKRCDTIAANGYTIRVESVRENRVEAVRISGSASSPSRSEA
ncbi:MAG TPA: hemolysin family protein [Solirubrobacterales bacterium]|nr:hemolysin family protein [Solirubrobacterales bacterium]